jgi:hypothetical protein
MSHILCLVWVAAVGFSWNGRAETLKRVKSAEPIQLNLFTESPPLQPVCSSYLDFTPSWRGSMTELMGPNEWPLFAKISFYSGLIVRSETQEKLKAHGFSARLDQTGYVVLSKGSTLRHIALQEPISHIEFSPGVNGDPDVFAIQGWTQTRYFQFNGNAFSETAEQVAFAPAISFHVQVTQDDRDEMTIRDSDGNNLYLNRKQFKNLLEQLDLPSKEALEAHVFHLNLRAPRQSLLQLFLEARRLNPIGPTAVSDILTHAALAIAHMKDPDFSVYFSPLVHEIFQIAFRADNLFRFSSHFGKVVEAASNGDLKSVSVADIHPSRDGEPVFRFQRRDGREYIVYYSFSSNSLPLHIVAAH